MSVFSEEMVLFYMKCTLGSSSLRRDIGLIRVQNWTIYTKKGVKWLFVIVYTIFQ